MLLPFYKTSLFSFLLFLLSLLSSVADTQPLSVQVCNEGGLLHYAVRRIYGWTKVTEAECAVATRADAVGVRGCAGGDARPSDRGAQILPSRLVHQP